MILASQTTAFGSLVQRVSVVAAKPDAAAVNALQQRLGNVYRVQALALQQFASTKSQADVIILNLDDATTTHRIEAS